MSSYLKATTKSKPRDADCTKPVAEPQLAYSRWSILILTSEHTTSVDRTGQVTFGADEGLYRGTRTSL
jgi:hypothetical protein